MIGFSSFFACFCLWSLFSLSFAVCKHCPTHPGETNLSREYEDGRRFRTRVILVLILPLEQNAADEIVRTSVSRIDEIIR